MRSFRNLAGLLGLAVLLALAGCGQADPQASLQVSSVPAAEIYVDGVSHGTSPATLALPAGAHDVELRLASFETFRTSVTLAADQTAEIDAALTAQDPSDPAVIAVLAQAQGIDVAPFVAPELTRGRTGKQAPAILLWPSRDVRLEGLVNYAIEADETYGGDATLEFRRGRDVLYREPFNPESITTVRSLPAPVLEAATVNTKITWGLYFEDRRRPITAEFRIVQRPKADRQLEKLATSRHIARQPEITQQILRAAVLENNRLYTEALVANLSIAASHPNSTQPYRGIVTTLRRLEAENSELFAFVAPQVGGRGGNAGVARPSSGLEIGAWSPSQAMPLPTMAGAGFTSKDAAGGTTAPSTPGSGPAGSTPGATVPTERVDPATAQAVQKRRDEMRQAQADALARHERATELAAEAARQGEEADRRMQAAAAEEAEARAAVEQAEQPTAEQQERLQLATDALEQARSGAQSASREVEAARLEVRKTKAHVDRTTEALQTAPRVPEETRVAPEQRNGAERTAKREAAQARLSQLRNSEEAARRQLLDAQRAFAEDPSSEKQAAVDAATQALVDLSKRAEEAQAAAEEAARSPEPEPEGRSDDGR